MKANTTRKALLLSVISFVLCLSMLVGTTYAWFTDSVVSSGNIIKSGNLKISLEWMEGTKAPAADSTDWKDASTGAIFDYDLWEPGYVCARHIKIENEGSLALKYKVTFEATGEVSELTDVIDVYYADPAVQVTGRDALTEDMKIGTLTEVLAGMETTAAGTLLKDGKDIITLVFKMQESAGNYYQGMSIGSEFEVKVFATQLTAESDSFNDQYDANADYDGEISNIDSFNAALKAGGNYKLINSFTVPAGTLPTIPAGTTVVLDLNGNTITAENSTTEYALNNLGDLTIYDSSVTTYSLRRSAAGSINARGIYNGYDPDGNYVTTAKLTILSGVYNALGTDGGAAVFNYGVANIKGGTFTAVGGYALNNRETGVMTIDDATTNTGIYNLGAVTVNGGNIENTVDGKHGVYHAGSTFEVNGGNFSSTAGNEIIKGATAGITINDGTFTQIGSSYIIDGTGIVINGGTFNDDDGQWNIRDDADVTIRGGNFNFSPAEKHIDEGFKAESIDGVAVIIPSDYQSTGYAGLYTDGEKNYFVYSAAGFAGLNNFIAENVKSVTLMADIDMTGRTWTSVRMHQDWKGMLTLFDGNGHTISNMAISGQAMFNTYTVAGDSVIRDVTFDNVTTTSGSINTAIVIAHLYTNAVFDNVDIVNCEIVGSYKVAPYIGTVYNENSATTVTATLKNCDVSNTVVKATGLDFCTTGMVAFVYAGDNDKVEFENCTVTDVELYAPNSYTAHAAVYTTGSNTLFNEVEGVTVSGVTFENI